MPQYDTWDEFVAAAKELFAAKPLKTRLVTKFRHRPAARRRHASVAPAGAGANSGAGSGAGAGGGKGSKGQDKTSHALVYDSGDKPRGVLVVKVTDDVVVRLARVHQRCPSSVVVCPHVVCGLDSA